MPDPPAELSAEAEEKARKRWERLTREREEVGPVNLRAEIEATEAEEAIATIERERGEMCIRDSDGSDHRRRTGRDSRRRDRGRAARTLSLIHI